MGKKDENRFTIQFNSTDPRHKIVAKILNRQGRRKAQYIVNAVLCYENGTVAFSTEQPPLLDYHAIENIVNQILARKAIPVHHQIKQPLANCKSKVNQSKEITFEDATFDIGQDSLSVIVDSIAEFRKKNIRI